MARGVLNLFNLLVVLAWWVVYHALAMIPVYLLVAVFAESVTWFPNTREELWVFLGLGVAAGVLDTVTSLLAGKPPVFFQQLFEKADARRRRRYSG